VLLRSAKILYSSTTRHNVASALEGRTIISTFARSLANEYQRLELNDWYLTRFGRVARRKTAQAGVGSAGGELSGVSEPRADSLTLAANTLFRGVVFAFRDYLFTAMACNSKCAPRSSEPAPMKARAGKSFEK
jgi:hypothetical protein